jgi:hypothetical protein
MPTHDELLKSLLAPVLVAALVAGVGRWRRWAWALPLAAGAGFLAGYALLGVPRLPPRDGSDWLFWAAVPVSLLGVLDAAAGGRRGGLLGAAAGAVAFVILRPLVPGAVSSGALWGTAAVLAAAGAGLVMGVGLAERWVGSAAVMIAMCVALGGAAVVVLSSNFRVMGIYGIAASAALGPVAASAATIRPGRTRLAKGTVDDDAGAAMSRVGHSVAVVAIPILAGLLAGGHYYADPGVNWSQFAVLLGAPALLLVGAAVPGRRDWVRGVVAVAAVAAVVAAVTVPAARAAKKAAEADPYENYYRGYQ